MVSALPDILARIVTRKREELTAKAALSREWEQATRQVDRRDFRATLRSKSTAVIAEIKKASPSAGLIRPDFNPMEIAREYQKSGAAALSVITEVQHFQGGLEILASLRWNTSLPLLRKDFIIDSYQTAKAKCAGQPAPEWFGLGELKLTPPIGAGILILLGALFLLDNLGIHIFEHVDKFWPVLLIAAGLFILQRRLGGGKPPAPPSAPTPSGGSAAGGPTNIPGPQGL